VDPLNAASLGLLRKLGFRETGSATATFFVGGRWADSVYLALHRPAA
jgi:ribosomal-protein-alanine N-acetyltransferase